MRFFAAAVALATAVMAQAPDFNPIYTPLSGEAIPAGSTYEITWAAPEAYLGAVVKISLIGGADQGSLQPVADIASGIANSDNKYSWAVDASLGELAVYGIVIALESDAAVFQYSNPFSISAGETTEPSASASASASASGVVTVTTADGVATVTLTSCPPEETTSAPIITSSAAPNTTITATSTPTWNTTTLVTLPPPATTPVVPAPPPSPTEPAPVPPPSVTAGAARYVSGSIALVGGFAMAMLL